MFLDIVFDKQSICVFQVNGSSINTPQNLVKFTISSESTFEGNLDFSRFLFDVMLDVPSIIKLVLLALTDNLFVLTSYYSRFIVT